MVSLDQRGDISIALLVIYPLVFIFSIILILRHGIRRQAGWLFLSLFSTAKIIGAILHIAAEKQNPPKIGLFIGAFAVEGAGLGPLMACTLSFIGAVCVRIIATHPIVTRKRLRLVHSAITAAVVLSIVGAINSNTTDSDAKQTASTLRKVGGIMFATAFVAIVLVHLVFWLAQHELMNYQKPLLKGISCAVPFLAVRVLYSVLSGFSPPASFGSLGALSGSMSGLAKFNSITGSWQLFLVMVAIMEFIVIATYIFFGLRLPISGGVDYESTATDSPFLRSTPLNSNAGLNSYPLRKTNHNSDQYA